MGDDRCVRVNGRWVANRQPADTTAQLSIVSDMTYGQFFSSGGEIRDSVIAEAVVPHFLRILP
jgi:hypothetical protein